MDRERYLQEVWARLSNRMPRKDLEGVMRYYEEYFDEAGPAREEAVMAELGTPEELVARILESRTKPKKSHGWVVGLVAGVGVLALVISAGAWNVMHHRYSYGETVYYTDAPIAVEQATVIGGGDTVYVVPGGNGSAYAELEPFTALDIDLPLGTVNLVADNHYGISMDWNGSKYQLHYECDGGELHIWGTGSEVGLANLDASVYIHVPAGAVLDRVDLDVDLGDCWLDGFAAEELTVDAAAGEVSLSNMTVQNAFLELDMGSLSINEVEAAAMEAVLSMGSLEGYGLQVSKSLTVKNAMGNIDLSGDLRGRLDLNCSMGAISVYCSGYEEEYGYDLQTGLGQVHVDGWGKGGSARRDGGTDFIKAKSDMGAVDVSFGFGY